MAEFKKPERFPHWAQKNNSDITNRYHLCGDGIQSDFNADAALPHCNHIEMSGFKTSAIISYRVDEKRNPSFYRFCVFPSKRILPDDTRGSLVWVFDDLQLRINNELEKVDSIFFNGILQVSSSADHARLTRRFIPGNDKCALIEEIRITPQDGCRVCFSCKQAQTVVKGKYTPDGQPHVLTTQLFFHGGRHAADARIHICEETTFYAVYAAEELDYDDVLRQIELREKLIRDGRSHLKITTPDAEINLMLELTKLRASESIFSTKRGLMHAPGGGSYYAALWTNDQCEYANPFFAYLGYDKAWEQSLNCYDLYAGLAREDKAIYTSIIAQGDDYWHGAGDRGDSSMFVYGFTRYLLTTGDRAAAEKYLPALETACVYIMSKMNDDMVIESDSDELENRFESGKANLSTAVISFDAFRSMSQLEKELGNTARAEEYAAFTEKIERGIHEYFEATVEGFQTYRYCKEEKNLRSWICLPLTIGICNRADGTIAALQSPALKKNSGLLTRSGSATYWDRSLLYALRGIFYAGARRKGLDMLREYTNTRLLGEHCPYPVEAFPEGNAAHLSAESALYNRIVTEGVLGFRPLGFAEFELRPNLPDEWDRVTVQQFYYAKKPLTLCVKAADKGLVTVEIPELSYQKTDAIGAVFTVDC